MPTKPDKIEKNRAKLLEAIGVLQQLAKQAAETEAFGVIGVEISYQNGVAHTVKRHFSDTVKGR